MIYQLTYLTEVDKCGHFTTVKKLYVNHKKIIHSGERERERERERAREREREKEGGREGDRQTDKHT